MFLAADATRLEELRHAVGQYLAWTSICEEVETLNLDPFQAKQAQTKCKNANDTVKARIPETYQWLLVPEQSDPKGSMEWAEIRQQGSDTLAVRASKKLKNEEMLLVQMGGVRLRLELDRIPLWRGPVQCDVVIKQLAEDFATYLYLPRLRDSDVLLAAIRDGLGRLTWQSETFAYADTWDEQKNRYVGLQTGTSVRVIVDGQSRLVKPDVAAAQIAADEVQAGQTTGGTTDGATGTGTPTETGTAGGDADGTQTGSGTKPEKPVLRRFHGSVQLDPVRIGRDAGRIAEEVIQHLAGLVGTDVEVTLEIRADIPDGAPDKTVRDVTENCRTLRFASFGFEEA